MTSEDHRDDDTPLRRPRAPHIRRYRNLREHIGAGRLSLGARDRVTKTHRRHIYVALADCKFHTAALVLSHLGCFHLGWVDLSE